MLIASSAELGTLEERGEATQRLLHGYAAELARCFRLQGEAAPHAAGASAEALLSLLGPHLVSSGLALVVGSFDTWYGMDERPAARARLAQRWAAVCVDAAPHVAALVALVTQTP